MDEPIIDLFYFMTFGNMASKKMSKGTKCQMVLNKFAKAIFNLKEDEADSFVKKELKKTKENVKILMDSNNALVEKLNIFEKKNNILGIDIDKLITQEKILRENLDFVSKLYEELVISYFNDRKLILDMSTEMREMGKKLNDTGVLKTVQLIYPSYKEAQNTILDVHSLNAPGKGGKIQINTSSVSILNPGSNFKLVDTIVGYANNKAYIFKATSLDDVKSNVSVNWAIPIHTQIYRYFYPDSFDVKQIQATQALIEKHGLEYVIKMYVASHLKV